MATLYGKNFTGAGGAPGSAGTDETRVDRINEGLPGGDAFDRRADE